MILINRELDFFKSEEKEKFNLNMPSKLRLRYIFRPFVKLIAKGLSKIGVSPNFATIIMFAFAISSVIFLLFFSRPLNLVIF
ncbi:MAG TPA: hypothetical protein VGB37_06805, partial [Candidatus Lokiarchaeia archaeon]